MAQVSSENERIKTENDKLVEENTEYRKKSSAWTRISPGGVPAVDLMLRELAEQ